MGDILVQWVSDIDIVVLFSFVSISQVIGWEGWVFCVSQVIGSEDHQHQNVSSGTLNPAQLCLTQPTIIEVISIICSV